METSRFDRLAPLTGIVYTILFYVAVFVGGDTPDADAKAAKVVSYWSDNDTKQIISALAGTIAIVALIWFAGVYWSRLRSKNGGSDRLALTAFGGVLVFASGVLVSVGLTFTLADVADNLQPAAVQALNALSSDMFLPMVGGLGVLYLATAAVTLRTGVLPKWIGWLSLVLGIASLTPIGWVPFLLSGVWVLAMTVIVHRKASAPRSESVPATAAA